MGKGPVDTTVQVHSLLSKVLMKCRDVSMLVHVHWKNWTPLRPAYFKHTMHVRSCQLLCRCIRTIFLHKFDKAGTMRGDLGHGKSTQLLSQPS